EAARIARDLGGKRNGSGYLCHCPVPGHGRGRGDRNPSLSVCDGDVSPLVHCFAGCDPQDVLNALRQRALLDDRPESASAPTRISRFSTRCTKPKSALRIDQADNHKRQQHAKATWLWSQRQPIPGTIAERYLREARHYAGPLPSTLAFLPARDQY